MNQQEFVRDRWSNRLHTALLFGSMLLLLALLGYLLAGTRGIIWLIILGAALLWFGQLASPRLMLRIYKARPLTEREAPALHQIIQELARRAELEKPPQLYYIPTKMMNAFAVGKRDDAYIGVTHGLLNQLSLRELTGVLAHEMSHVHHNDMRVMAMADVISRLTSLLGSAGQLLLVLNLFSTLFGMGSVSWWAVLLLLAAPNIVGLLQLALSRTREYDADLEAARLTGDPEGLISALQKIEHYSTNMLQRILMPGHSIPAPSVLRSHPHTNDRVRELRELIGDTTPMPIPQVDVTVPTPTTLGTLTRRPSWHMLGIWY